MREYTKFYINGERVERQPIAELPAPDARYSLGLEALGGSNHLMQVDSMRPGRDFSVVVQPGHYFMMGDNRDNSEDSRIWGFVPHDYVKGRAIFIYWSWNGDKFLPRLNRIGDLIR